MPAIVQGQDFASLQDFKNALHDWAIEKGFTAAILDSDCHRVRAGCRSSPGCPFRIRANYNERRGHARVTTVEDVHTCTSATGPLTKQDIKRAETSKLKFLVEAVPKHMTVDHKTPTTAIIEVVKEKYGQNIALRQAQKVKAILCPKSKQACGHCGRNHASTVPCPQSRPRIRPTSQSASQTLLAEDTSGFDFSFSEEQPQHLYSFTVASNPPPTSGPTLLSTSGPTLLSNAMSQALPFPSSSLPTSTREIIIRSQPATTLLDPRLATETHPHSTGPTNHQVPSQPRHNNPARHPTSNPPQPLTAASTHNPSHNPVTQPSQIAPVTQPPQLTTSTPSHLPTSQPASQPPPSAPTAPIAPALPTPRPTAPPQTHPLARTPHETRLEAARLMQNAARLMQEAARMNAEAARLTASVASF